MSEEYSVKVDVHQGCVLLSLLFAMVIDEGKCKEKCKERDGNCKERLDEANSLCRRFSPNGETMEELRENFN